MPQCCALPCRQSRTQRALFRDCASWLVPIFTGRLLGSKNGWWTVGAPLSRVVFFTHLARLESALCFFSGGSIGPEAGFRRKAEALNRVLFSTPSVSVPKLFTVPTLV